MSDTPFDMEAATQAIAAGQSVAEFAGFSPDLLRFLYATAVGHFEAQRYEEAIQIVRQLVVLDLRDPDYWALFGNCLMREGQFAEAVDAWHTAMILKPSFATAALVARTAIAIKDRQTAAEALLALRTCISTQAQSDECTALLDAMLALPA